MIKEKGYQRYARALKLHANPTRERKENSTETNDISFFYSSLRYLALSYRHTEYALNTALAQTRVPSPNHGNRGYPYHLPDNVEITSSNNPFPPFPETYSLSRSPESPFSLSTFHISFSSRFHQHRVVESFCRIIAMPTCTYTYTHTHTAQVHKEINYVDLVNKCETRATSFFPANDSMLMIGRSKAESRND